MTSPSERTNHTTAIQLPRPLRGIIPPMVTPLSDYDKLDTASLERLIEHILGGGVHGLFILGTTGEATSLSYRLRQELIERTCRQVHGRVPVLVGITDTAFAESVRLAGLAAEAGAAAVVVAPPYYLAPGQVELLEYLEHLVRELPLPLFLYNQPSHTKVSFEVQTVRQAAELPGIVGLKDSSANMLYFQRLLWLLADRPDFALLMGPEELLGQSVLLGGHGGVPGGANLYPQLYVQIYEAARSRDLNRLLAGQQQIMQISTGIYGLAPSGSTYLRGLKCALSILGICGDCPAEPFRRLDPPQRTRIEHELRGLGLLSG
jgi:dihydrodipicolinate synthase/N-acetylneuraminate lyase